MIKGKLKLLAVLLLLYAGAKMYKYLPYKIELLGHYSKIWAHRIDSVSRLQTAALYFDGVELDIVYSEEDGYLDITHPPAKPIGLSLHKYLNNLPNDKQPFLWLDIKNLEENNADEILNQLKKTLNKYAYPFDKVLVETRYPEALKRFTQAGFKASYYLPYGLSKLEAPLLKESVLKIKEVLKQQPKIGISADIQDYVVMKKYFPNKDKYLWTMGYVVRNHFIDTQKALRDPKVKVLLVSYTTVEGNR